VLGELDALAGPGAQLGLRQAPAELLVGGAEVVDERLLVLPKLALALVDEGLHGAIIVAKPALGSGVMGSGVMGS
jgi:hypothetical protein